MSPAFTFNDAQVKTHLNQTFKSRRLRRWWTDKIIVYVLSLCSLLVIFALFNILTHLLTQGISSINGEFLTHLPKPVGESGGGMANALVGSLLLLGIAILVGVGREKAGAPWQDA